MDIGVNKALQLERLRSILLSRFQQHKTLIRNTSTAALVTYVIASTLSAPRSWTKSPAHDNTATVSARSNDDHNEALRSLMDKGHSNEQSDRRGDVNKLFLKRLYRILKMLIPSIWSKQCALLLTHTTFLVLRTCQCHQHFCLIIS